MGATHAATFSSVLRAGMLLAIGLAIGVGLAIGTATFARSLLFRLHRSWTIAMRRSSAIAATGGLLPAHRAATLDPVTTLRED